MEWFLGLYSAVQVALVGAAIYANVRMARVEAILSAPVTGVVALLEDLRERVGVLESRRRA